MVDVTSLPAECAKGERAAVARYDIAPIERLPKWLLCVPLVVQWHWLGLLYGSISLPTNVNPRIEGGGLVGESKISYLAMIGAAHRAWVADTVAVGPGADAADLRAKSGLEFPLIAKPDIGWCGYGVRRIDDEAQLAAYAAAFPSDAIFLLQRFVDQPGEAGLSYVREPGAEHGRLEAVTIRHQPHVVGDGVRSVSQLIAGDVRASRMDAFYRAVRGDAFMESVPAKGERVLVTTVASLRVGSRYEDASRLIAPALNDRLDAIARSMGDFHYGRFDVRFADEAALARGEFTIIEVNGAGSEAIQFWDPGLTLVQAYRGVFAKQRALFALAQRMRRLGHKPIGALAMARAHLKQQRLIKLYPPSN